MEEKRVVKVTPMSLDQYGKIYGVIVFDSGDGYLVEYSDGTSSWGSTDKMAIENKSCKQEECDECEEECFDCGQAITALVEGSIVTRKAWNNQAFVTILYDDMPDETGVALYWKFPASAQQEILKQRTMGLLHHGNKCVMVNKDGRCDSWLPNAQDIFAKDWQYYKTKVKDEV